MTANNKVKWLLNITTAAQRFHCFNSANETRWIVEWTSQKDFNKFMNLSGTWLFCWWYMYISVYTIGFSYNTFMATLIFYYTNGYIIHLVCFKDKLIVWLSQLTYIIYSNYFVLYYTMRIFSNNLNPLFIIFKMNIY